MLLDNFANKHFENVESWNARIVGMYARGFWNMVTNLTLIRTIQHLVKTVVDSFSVKDFDLRLQKL